VSTSELGRELFQRFLDEAPQENIDTKPPDSEVVTFRTVTLNEVYVGVDLQKFLARLKSIATHESKYDVCPEIENAIQYDLQRIGNFSIHPHEDQPQNLGILYRARLPEGVMKVSAKYYLLGPNCLSVNLVFCMDVESRLVIDTILREYVVPKMIEEGGIQFQNVFDIKRSRCTSAIQDAAKKCQLWASEFLPGTLNESGNEPMPAVACLTTREEVPFLSGKLYMRLLGLTFPSSIMKIFDAAPVFLSQRLTNRGPYRFALSARESELMTSNKVSPDQLSAFLTETAGPLFVLNGLDALVRKLDSEVRDLRSEIIELDIEKSNNQKLADLRIRLSKISRLVSTISHEYRNILTQDHLAWSAFPNVHTFATASMSESKSVSSQNFLGGIDYSIGEVQASTDQLIQQSAIMASAIGDSLRIDQERTLSRFNRILVVLTALLVVAAIVQGIIDISTHSSSHPDHTSRPIATTTTRTTTTSPIKSGN